MFGWFKHLFSATPTVDDYLKGVDNDLCHVYCSFCYPASLPRGYTHFCGTPNLEAGDSTPCTATCEHVMCLVCLDGLDTHMAEWHRGAARP